MMTMMEKREKQASGQRKKTTTTTTSFKSNEKIEKIPLDQQILELQQQQQPDKFCLNQEEKLFD